MQFRPKKKYLLPDTLASFFMHKQGRSCGHVERHANTRQLSLPQGLRLTALFFSLFLRASSSSTSCLHILLFAQQHAQALKPKREVACLCGRGSKQVEEQDADIMRGVGAFCCALAAVQGAMGFVAPLSARALGRQAARNTFSSEPATRLRMVATDFPKFSVSLMDDTRVSFHMDEEHVRKLAAEVLLHREPEN